MLENIKLEDDALWSSTCTYHLQYMRFFSFFLSESPFSSGVVVGEWFLGNVVYTVSCYMGSHVVFMSLTKGEHSQQYCTVPPSPPPRQPARQPNIVVARKQSCFHSATMFSSQIFGDEKQVFWGMLLEYSGIPNDFLF